MKPLELQLEDVGYCFEEGTWRVHIEGAPMPEEDAARKFAALEFFDCALMAAFSDQAGLAHSISEPGYASGLAFSEAVSLTLLRFGVRIVGLRDGDGD